MSGSCCGGSAKSEPNKVAMTSVVQTTEPAAERPAANSKKSECCGNESAKNEKQGCAC